jgi:O-antigen/teichoic acid export membrane protein
LVAGVTRLRFMGGGALLAASNVYSGLSVFVILSILFNSVDLRTFGSISLMLTSVAICQVLFNTQSWQGLLNCGVQIDSELLRRCLAIDVFFAICGSVLLLIGYGLFFQDQLPNVDSPAVLLWITMNVALIPPGTLVGVIRQEGRFAQQALVDISVSTLKIGLALIFIRGVTSIHGVALTLVLPEILRWIGYFFLTAPRLITKSERSFFHGNIVTTASKPTLRNIYEFSVWGMLNEIFHLPTTHVDKLLVSAFLGLEQMAVWDVIKRCGTAVVQLTTVINQMLFPYYVRIRNDTPVEILIRQCLKQCLLLSMVLLLLYGMATLTLPLWLPFAFHIDTLAWPLEYLQKVFGLFAIVMCFVLGATPVHSLFLSQRHSSQSFIISVLGNVIFFGLSAFLLPLWGLYAASLAILGSDALIILIKFQLLKSKLAINHNGPSQ